MTRDTASIHAKRAMPFVLAASLACGLPGPAAMAQTNQLRGLNTGNATTNLPSAEQQLQRSQDRQRSTLSNRNAADSAERRDRVDDLNRNAAPRAAGNCDTGATNCRQ